MLQVCPRWGGALSSRPKAGTGCKKKPHKMGFGDYGDLGNVLFAGIRPLGARGTGLCWYCHIPGDLGWLRGGDISARKKNQKMPKEVPKGRMWLRGQENPGKIQKVELHLWPDLSFSQIP